MRYSDYFLISALLLAGLALGFTRTDSGDPIRPSMTTSPPALWSQIGTTSDVITASNSTPAVGARDYSALWTDLPDANKITCTVPNEAYYGEFRFRTTADADAQVVEIWVAAGSTMRDGTTEESFQLGAILTLTGGKQVGPESDQFVDTIVAADYTLDGEVMDSAADRIAIYWLDLRSYKKIVMIATTLAAKTTLTCDARFTCK